ncbi:MAG: DUF4214 domain-containing protein [Acidimicrobiales bacterium]|nr:DUF4214 domain-containing protein [Acidimicrobiales bacterium]
MPAASSPFSRQLLALAATFLAVVMVPITPAAATRVVADSTPVEGVTSESLAMSPLERALAERIAADHNDARRDAGLSELRQMPSLAPYAGSNSMTMMATQTLGHSEIRVLLDDFPQNMWAAENALVMFNPASEATDLWLGSPEHAANMMASRATHVWVDVRCSAEGRMWVTSQYVDAPVAQTDILPGVDLRVSDSASVDLRCPVAVGPFASGEAFVAQQYEDFLGRPADASGLAYWTGMLNTRKVTPGQVVLSFLNSPEFAGRIRPRAEAALLASSELPTVDEVDSWRRTPPPQVSTKAAAAGVKSRVDVLMIYVGMLNRTPDAKGFAYWTGLADQEVSLTVLVNGFLASPEYTARVGS